MDKNKSNLSTKNHVKTCLLNLSNLKLFKNWTAQKIGLCVFKDFNKGYFKIFEINKNQIREAATKEVFCEKDVLELLATSLKIMYFFKVSFVGGFSIRI